MLDQLVILTTTRCDLTCRHCLRGPDQKISDFPLELLSPLLEEARLFGARKVGLSGGEPGMHPQFAQMVEQIVEAGYSWGFVTNGQQTRRYLPLVKRYRQALSSVSISLDGACPETHDVIRQRPGAFQHALKAARQYCELDIPLHIKFTANRLNQVEVLEMIPLAMEWGAESIHFAGLIPAEHNLDLALNDAELQTIYEQLFEANKDAPLKVSSHYSSLHTRGGVLFCNNLQLNRLMFNSRGELIFCCDVPGEDEAVGSLTEAPLAELIERWLMTSARLQTTRVRHIAEGNLPEGFDHCQFCIETLNK